MKKKVLTILLTVAIIFAAYHIMWFAWSHIKYGKYTGGMEETDFSNFFTPRYAFTDADRYDYLVKYPDYLSFTGNLSVGLPSADGNFFTDALIIWPKAGGGYELGALLYDEDGSGYSVYIDAQGNALSKEDEEVVSRHRENIRDLMITANQRWGVFDGKR